MNDQLDARRSVHSNVTGSGADAWRREHTHATATIANDLVFVSGQVASDENGRVVGAGDIDAQTAIVLEKVVALVEEAGGRAEDLVEVICYVKDIRFAPIVESAARTRLSGATPAWTTLAMTGTWEAGHLVAMKAIADIGPGRVEPLVSPRTSDLPFAGGAAKNGLVFVAGQHGAVDADGRFTAPGDHLQQALESYKSGLEILRLAGGDLGDVLDFTSAHVDMRGGEPTLMGIYSPEILGPDQDPLLAPTTAHIGVPALPVEGALSSFRLIADTSAGERECSMPDKLWWKGIYPLTGGARKPHGRLMMIAGQVASEPPRGAIVGLGDPVTQANHLLDCLESVLQEFGMGLEHVAEICTYHKDVRTIPMFLEQARPRFGGNTPAWTPIGVAELWKEEYLLELTAVAVMPD